MLYKHAIQSEVGVSRVGCDATGLLGFRISLEYLPLAGYCNSVPAQ